MAVAFKNSLGTGLSTVSGTTVTITTTAEIFAGDLVVVRWAADNLSATTPTATCADGGNTYTVLRQAAVNVTAGNGIAGGILATKATVYRAAGSTITITLSGAVAHKSAYAESFSGSEITVRSTAVSATGASTLSNSTASGTVVAGDLVLGWVAWETRSALTGDADTGGGTWSTIVQQRSATSGSDTLCVSVGGQYKIPNNATAQTYNVSSVNSEWATGVVVLQPSPPPPVTQYVYRFYNDDGPQATNTPAAAENTALTGDTTAGDFTTTLRIAMYATSVASPTTESWQLQYSRNGGAWTNIGLGSTHVQAYNSANLSNGGSTTNTGRLTGPVALQAAGQISESGQIGGRTIPATYYVEDLYTIKVIKSAVTHADVLTFRVVRDALPDGLTYSVTPTINVVKPIPGPKLDTLTDTFTTEVSTTTWPWQGSEVTWEAGRVKLPVNGNYNALSMALDSGPVYDLTSSHLYAQVVLPAMGGSNEFFIEIRKESATAETNNRIYFRIGEAPVEVQAVKVDAGNYVTVFEDVPYNPTTMACLRIREAGGNVYFEYSADGSGWQGWGSTGAPAWDLTRVRVSFSVGHWNAADPDSVCYIDNVNTIPVPTGGKIKWWSGSAWVDKPVKRYNGTAWVEKPVKVWNGSSWVLS